MEPARFCSPANRHASRQGAWIRCLTDLVLPPHCAVCDRLLAGSVEPLVCRSCRAQLVQSPDSACSACGGQRIGVLPLDDRCARCRERKFPFEGAVALGDYHGLLRQVVIAMKHRGQECLSIQIGHLLGERIRRHAGAAEAELVVPIPIYWTRRLSRGANVAALLAEGVHRQTGIAVEPALLRYNRATRKQGMLSTAQRFANVRGAIELTRRAPIRGRRVLLVDDVMTSCATACQAAKVLRRAGATVRVAVVARGGAP